MKPGRKPAAPSEKQRRGTYRRDRDGAVVEVTAADALPIQPEWLTEAGRDAWLDNIGRVSSTGKATELDSALFGQFCNLLGAVNLAWAAGDVPPISALAELRRFGELFGLAGGSSRLGTSAVKKDNPFLVNGARNHPAPGA